MQQSCCASPRNASARTCSHLQALKEKGGLEAYSTIQQYLQSCNVKLVDHSKLPLPRCFVCSEFCGRLHICLQCVYIGCWSEGHLRKHFEDSHHSLAVDTTLNQIYCAQCGDYVYDTDFDDILTMEKHNVLSMMQSMSGSNPNRSVYRDWVPSNDEAENLGKNSKRYNVPPHIVGLRGLTNLGNTCFMNCILQSFVHNPLMRNYFLSDMHNSRLCTQRQHGENKGICLGCEMDKLYAQIFSGIRTPYTPHHMLYSIWKYANYFAGYEQQDAHEFLISSLNGIHTHCGGQPKDCPCIIHRIFYGVLRSDVTCASCNFTSVTFDPFFDISLDIPKPKIKITGTSEKRDHKDDEDTNPTLMTCLDRFTQPERLGSNEKCLCSNCHTRQESIKQLSMKSLPIVICFHLKRFEQAANPRHSNKIDTFIEFPAVLNMRPYMAANVLSNQKGKNKRHKAADSEGIGKRDKLSNGDDNHGESGEQIDMGSEIYELFAVVNHQGKMDNGHYTCFVRHTDMWFKCDDATITRATLQQVLRSKGYLLFYMKRHLEYSHHQKSCNEKQTL